MPSLLEMQRGFATALLGPGTGRAPTIRADGLSPSLRLGFYRNNVLSNYTRALRLTFPVVERLVGPACFAELARHYIARYPYRAGDLTDFGDRFADFIGAERIGIEHPYLSDVARLEWAMEEVFNEADHPGLTPERLASLPLDRCERLRFLLHPASRLLRSCYPLRRIWQFAQPGSQEEGALTLEDMEECVLIYRHGYEVDVEPLEAGEYALLAALASGSEFGAAYERARQSVDPAAFLSKFIGRGILADYTLPADALWN